MYKVLFHLCETKHFLTKMLLNIHTFFKFAKLEEFFVLKYGAFHSKSPENVFSVDRVYNFCFAYTYRYRVSRTPKILEIVCVFLLLQTLYKSYHAIF